MSTSYVDAQILHSIEWQASGGTPTNIAMLSVKSPIYDVDLNTRKIDAPKFLGVQDDHQADRIYFKIDRFFDNMDLSSTIVLIHYRLPDKSEYVYVVPFIDIYTFGIDNKILIPWVISGLVTAYEGTIEFSIKFFKTAKEVLINNQPELLFELNTLPAKSQILKGLAPNLNHTDYSVDSDGNAINKILLDTTLWNNLERIVEASGQWNIYWNDV